MYKIFLLFSANNSLELILRMQLDIIYIYYITCIINKILEL